MFDVLIGTAKGELHFINGLDGSEVKGFPTKMDSITTQVFTVHVCVNCFYNGEAAVFSHTSLFWTPLGQFGTDPSVLIREVTLFQR